MKFSFQKIAPIVSLLNPLSNCQIRIILCGIILLLAGGTSGIMAQDTLFYTNGSRQIVKVTEVGIDEVKFRDYKDEYAPLFVVGKEELHRIGFADGNSLRFNEDMTSFAPTPEGLSRTRIIKIEFLTPLHDCLEFGYERLVKRGISLEVKLGIIGAGFDANNENASGGLVKAGIKFMGSPDYYVRGMKRTHPLRGAYVKPELIFNTFSADVEYNNSTQKYDRVNYTNFAVNIVFGKQAILSERMTLDWYVGAGYGGQWTNKSTTSTLYQDETANYKPNVFSHIYGGHKLPLVVSGGLSIGYLLK